MKPPAVTGIFAGLPPWLILIGGTVLGWLQAFWSAIYRNTVGYVVRKVHISLSVEESETEEAYLWLNLWAERRIHAKRTTALRLISGKSDETGGREYLPVPQYGTYWLRFRSRYLLMFSSNKDTGSETGSDAARLSFLRPRRWIQIEIWGTLDRRMLLELIDDARREFYAKLEKKLYVYHNEGGWWNSREMAQRRWETIYLPEKTSAGVATAVDDFLSSRETYRALGFPWRLGLLFHGPPGTGKSSLAQALATRFEMPIYYLTPTSVERPEDLQRLFNSVASRSIVLIEDVDCVPAARARIEAAGPAGDGGTSPTHAEPSSQPGKGIIAADLLNVIDGVIATEGRVLILTTNFADRLDPALLRAGRIDYQFHIGFAGDEELRRFYVRAKAAFALNGFESFRGALAKETTIAEAQRYLFQQPKTKDVA